MRRYLIHILIFGAALTILLFYFLNLQRSWTQNEAMSRAQIARMLALMRYDGTSCKAALEEISTETLPGDWGEGQWYGKYVAVVLKEGWMSKDENGAFRPEGVFTYDELRYIMEAFHLSESSLSFSLKYRQKDGMVPKSQWCEVYQRLCADSPLVTRNYLEIQGSSEHMTELKAWQVMTDQGIKTAEGLGVNPYLNQTAEVYMAEDELLCIIRALPKETLTSVKERLETETTEDSKKSSENEVTLRVLLHGAGDGNYEHASVTVTAAEPFYVSSLSETTRYEQGSEVTLDGSMVSEGEVQIKTESERGKIQLLSLERASGVPSYHGSIWLRNWNGNLLLINEVGMEDYVAGVIPGEMPVSYGMEALKVQAVCARTFGKRAIGSEFQGYPANLDDTVSSQVYNNQFECEESIQAARETAGQVLQNSEGLTATYFFSTSCGHTSDPEDVWYSGSEAANEAAVSVFLSDDRVSLALSQEADFRKFIDQEDGYRYFEEDLPWFRWQTYLSAEEIQTNVGNVTGTDIGELRNISILERAESGLLKAIRVEGSLDVVDVYGEYQIRQIFSPVSTEIYPQNGEVMTGWNLLPSAYCYINPVIEADQCMGYEIRGGGYGHGSGMSQNGAMKMAEMGKGYEEILRFFFPDSKLVTE